MKKLHLLLTYLCFSTVLTAQKNPVVVDKEFIPSGTQVTVTKHTYTAATGNSAYTVHTGYLDIKNDTGKLVAKIFFTYYKKDGEEVSRRPVCFTFNGGPGSSSVWLHVGGLAPKRVQLQDDGTATAPPYKMINNEYSWLDKTDLVFIDPVATGYSRPAPGENPKQFHGYVEDIQSVGAFIRHFLSKYERWASPKYLAGESYGTTRAAGLSKYLQDSYRIYFNGIFLISPVLNFGTNDYYVGHDLPRALYLPSFTAAAWYHKKLAPALQQDFNRAIKESEQFALGEYASALLQGDWLTEADKSKIAEKMSYYTGLTKAFCLQANLRVTEERFYKELRRGDGLTIGRLDARFTGRDLDDAGEYVSFDPSFTNIDGPFTSAINDYFQRDLNFKDEKPYNIFGNVYPWNYSNVQNKFLNVAESLRDAMTKNPALKVYIGSGYYDFATPYFTAAYDVEHMFLRPEARKNIKHYYYHAGHMYYINMPDLVQFKKDIDAFFDWSLKGK
ncbi:MAG TPA: carboxypeptidase [Ferruginibacter sp.]|nr:carboxypeptidase [Ferruginibacter sp.]HMP20419.1 carboxypeptidase [Ferruginibacter sp.]